MRVIAKYLGSGLLAVGVGAGSASGQRPAACCSITEIEAATGVVSGKVTANGNVFQFKVTNARTLATLRVGQGVFANFTNGQVSLDGRTACCTVTSGPTAPTVAPPARAPVPPAPAPAPVRAPAPAPPPAPPAVPPAAPSAARAAPTQPAAARVVNALPITAAMVNQPPTLTFGPPEPRTTVRTRATSRFQTATMTAQVPGRGTVTAPVLYLRGLKAVDEAPGLDPGARRLLKMLVRRVPLDQSDHYIVNTQMAQEWIAAHPVPDNVKPTEPKEKKCGNWYDSWDCAGQAVTDEWQRTYDHAVNEWDNAEKTLAEAWETTVACFTERTITSGEIPVKFSITPSMTVNLSQGGSRGSAQGTVSGSATLGIPIQSDVAARLDLFYIPCVPFAVRPKEVAGSGLLTVGQELKAVVSATGSFDKTFTIPPTGGPSIPIQVFPIIIGGVPIAILDVSVYIEGEVQVSAEGKAEGQFQIKNSNPTHFSFSCNGRGCSARSNKPPSSTTTNESAQIEGTVSVKPAIYAALELNFNYEALSARAGPQPYLLGTAAGCAAIAGSQTAGGASTSTENHVLSADLDWGVELRAEALVMGKFVGDSYRTRLMADKHLWFRDMAPGGSNALVAMVASTGPAVAGQRADHRVKMPTCYPYTNRVKYDVSWTGAAVPPSEPTTRSSPCTWQAAQRKGTCSFDPAKEFVISLVWPTAGSYTLTVAPVSDTHDRVFTPAPKATQVSVTVAPAGGGGAP